MKKKKYLVVFLTSFLIVGLFWVCRKVIVELTDLGEVMTQLTTSETAEDIASVNEAPDWLSELLPALATHISYWRLPWTCTAFEYEVNEDDFLKWARKNEIPLTKIKGTTRIDRYLLYPDTDDPNELSEYFSKKDAVVTEGYEYHWVKENGGGCGLHIVYDSMNRKAYHYYPNR